MPIPVATTAGAFELVEVKLAAPFTRAGTVAKTDVIARLRAASVPFATVVAPAGYGKTTLLARWAEADPRPFAWVALDGRDDDDAVVFLRYIAAAIHRCRASAARGVRGVVRPRGIRLGDARPASRERTGGTRAAAGAGARRSARSSPIRPVWTCSRSSFEYVPAGSQIAIASREEPALPLARWRAQGRVHEIGVAELRLDEQEAGLLLEAAGVELDGERGLRADRADGGLACRPVPRGAVDAGRGGKPAGAEGFNGDDRFVSEYFRFELLSRLPTAEARFLMYTSVLDRMCGGLCDAVLETNAVGTACSRRSSVRTAFWCPSTGGASGIATTTCSASCCGTSSSGASRTSWRRSTVVRWLVHRQRPDGGRGRATGTPRARRAPSPAWSTPSRCPLYYDGRMETVEEWLGWFGDDELVQYPALAVYGAWFRALTGRPEEAERWLALADGATSAIPLSDGSATIEPWVATLRAHMMAKRCRAGARRRRSGAGSAPHRRVSWIPVALLIRGVAHALLGATDRATDDLTAAVERGLAVGGLRRRLRGSRPSSRSSPPSKEPGATQLNTHERRKRSSRRRASATTRRARSRTSRRRVSLSTRRDTRTPARRWPAPTGCGHCSTTAFPG